MLLLETDKLRTGMVAAAPVRHPAVTEVELVMPGVELEPRMIRTLQRLGIQKLWVRWPGLDFLDSSVNFKALALRHDVYDMLKRDFEASQATTVGVT